MSSRDRLSNCSWHDGMDEDGLKGTRSLAGGAKDRGRDCFNSPRIKNRVIIKDNILFKVRILRMATFFFEGNVYTSELNDGLHNVEERETR